MLVERYVKLGEKAIILKKFAKLLIMVTGRNFTFTQVCNWRTEEQSNGK